MLTNFKKFAFVMDEMDNKNLHFTLDTDGKKYKVFSLQSVYDENTPKMSVSLDEVEKTYGKMKRFLKAVIEESICCEKTEQILEYRGGYTVIKSYEIDFNHFYMNVKLKSYVINVNKRGVEMKIMFNEED